MYGCAEVSAVDTYILKALLHILIGALPSPGSVSLAADFGTWLELHQCRESWETDHSHQHRTVTGRSYQVLLSLSAVLQVTRKNWHGKKKGQLTRVGKGEDNQKIRMEDRSHEFT